MYIKLIVSVLLVFSTGKAFPSLEEEPSKKQLVCAAKQAWYGQIINETKSIYDEYKAKLTEAKLNVEIMDKLTISSQFKNKTAEILKIYELDSETYSSISDRTTKAIFCNKSIFKYRQLSVNLTKLATNLKNDTLAIIDDAAIAKDVKNGLEKVLSKLVNFLFLSKLKENKYKDVDSLKNETDKQTNDGVAMEKNYEFNDHGELEKTVAEIDEEYQEILSRYDDLIKNQTAELEDDKNILDDFEPLNHRVEEFDDAAYLSFSLFAICLGFIISAVVVGTVLSFIRIKTYLRFS